MNYINKYIYIYVFVGLEENLALLVGELLGGWSCEVESQNVIKYTSPLKVREVMVIWILCFFWSFGISEKEYQNSPRKRFGIQPVETLEWTVNGGEFWYIALTC